MREKARKSGPKPKAGRMVELLLLEGELSDQEIVDRVRLVYPKSTMTRDNVRWYRWRLRKRGELSVL